MIDTTVKEKRGRRRYIAFSVDVGLNRTMLMARLGNRPPYIVQCGRGFAVIRCSPGEKDETIGRMRGADPSSSPIMTSGTLRALRAKVPGLEG